MSGSDKQSHAGVAVSRVHEAPMKTNSQPLFRSAAAVALSALFLAACSGGKEQGGAPGAGGPPPAPAVTVMTLKSESVPMVVELKGVPGHDEGLVEIRREFCAKKYYRT